MEVFKMYKNSFKLEQKRGRFSAVSRDFCPNFCFLRMPWLQRGCHDVFRGHSTLKKQKFVQKSCRTAKKRPRVCWWHCSHPRRLDFINQVSHGRQSRICVLRLPWPPRTSWHWHIRRMPVSYWTSGGCQSEGPRGLRPLGPTDWHPPSVQ